MRYEAIVSQDCSSVSYQRIILVPLHAAPWGGMFYLQTLACFY